MSAGRISALLPPVLALVGLACTQSESTQTAAPKVADAAPAVRPTKPGWAFDAPEYARPASEPDPALRESPQDPLHYFLNSRTIYVRRPALPQNQAASRLPIYATQNKGASWQHVGYFGAGQTFFPYDVQADGEYDVRFQGPLEAGAKGLPASPQRVYHVDTTAPNVWVTVEPLLAAYRAGQIIMVDWGAFDRNLIERPVQISVTEGDESWRLVVTDQPSFGALAFSVPASAEGSTVQFKIEALDRAGNLGKAVGPKLHVATRPAPEVAVDVNRFDSKALALADHRAPMSPPADSKPTDARVESPAPPSPAETPVHVAPADTAAEAPAAIVSEIPVAREPEPDPVQDQPSHDDEPRTATHEHDIPADAPPASESDTPAPPVPAAIARLEGDDGLAEKLLSKDTAPPSALDDPVDSELATESRLADAEAALAEMRVALCPLIDAAPPVELTTVTPPDEFAFPDEYVALVPTLPALQPLPSKRGERPWQSLGQYASDLRTRVWSLPRPQFLTELAEFVQQRFKDMPVAPVAPRDEPKMVKAADSPDSAEPQLP